MEAVAPDGVAVLNAADPLVAVMAGHCPGRVVFFAQDATHPVLTAHRARGERAVFIRSGAIVFAEGEREEVLTALENVPLTHGGRVGFQVENVLAACAAVWSLQLPFDALRAGLASFTGDTRQAPGRFNVLRAGDATVIVDYAHNPSALAALVEALAAFPHRRRSFVFTPSNRRDVDVLAMGRIIGDGFDRVLLYLDENGADGSAAGALSAVLRRGIEAGTRHPEITETHGELTTIDVALSELRAGDLLVLGVDAIEEALTFVQSRLG